jgi:hypothetical protein
VATAVTGARLCSAVFTKQTPVVLEVAVKCVSELGGSSVTSAFDLFAVAMNAAASSMGTGQLIVEYGSGGAYERVAMDLRGGSYQLPPCEEVRVSVTTTEVGAFLPALSIGGAITAGTHPSPTVPTYTWRDEALATDATVGVPARARTVDCWIGNTTGAAIYGSGAPVLSLLQNACQPQLIRDYSLGVWAPPYPAPCVPGGEVDTTVFRKVDLFTTVACEAVVQFQLEL